MQARVGEAAPVRESGRRTWVRRVLAAIAILFGIATVIAGTRVLAGADPGYIVFRPLLVYNAAMGIAYVAAGVLALRGNRQGLHAAGVIFTLNCLVLGVIGYLYASGGGVAIESLRAMSFRAAVWLALWFGFMYRPGHYWFAVKRYGWGWGRPLTWQGWAVLGLYIVSVVAVCLAWPPGSGVVRFIVLVVVASALLILVCWLTGAPPRWSWGERHEAGS